MTLQVSEIVSLGKDAVELLRDVRDYLKDHQLDGQLADLRDRILAVRDPDSEGGRRITKGEARQLLADLLDFAIHLWSLHDDPKVRRIGARTNRLVKAILRDIAD